MKIVVDSSALVAILLVEATAVEMAIRLATASERVMSTSSYLETAIVCAGRGIEQARLDELVKKGRIKRLGLTAGQADLAVAAIRKYGKGHGNKAQLNLGDLHSYALAKSKGWPLLFVGNDFPHTDLLAA